MTGPPALRPHRLPTELLSAVAAGRGGREAVEALAAVQLSRNRVLARAVVELAHVAGHPEARQARSAYRALAEVEQAAPGVVHDLLRYPTVSAWLRATAAALRRPAGDDGDRVRPGRFGAVAAAAAVRAGVAVRLPPGPVGPGPTVILPSVGQAFLPGDDEPLAVAPGDGVTLARGRRRLRVAPEPGSPGWVALPRVSYGEGVLRLSAPIDGAGWRLVPGGGPDPRIASALDAIEPRRWLRRVDAGWRLLSAHHEPVAAEAAAAVSALVPLRATGGSLVSGTFRDGFGAVAMSLPADARSVALTLAHEVQHSKLVGVMDALPLVVPGGGELFYAPWREDPRPLGALLHGTYAHLGVAAFWRRQRLVEDSEEEAFMAHVAFARWRAAAWAATEAVRSTGRLTQAGALMLDGMRAALREFLAEPVPHHAQRLADDLAARHRRRSVAGRCAPAP